MHRTYLRGDLYYANLSPVVGSEQAGYRPVLLLQNDHGNRHSPTVIVAPITTKAGVKAKLPTHVLLANALPLPSVVLLEQIRTIDKRRLEAYLGHLDHQTMQRINKRILISLGIAKNAQRKEEKRIEL